MIFKIDNEKQKDKEIEKFLDYIGYYPNLYKNEERTKIESKIINYIGEVNVSYNKQYVEEKVYGDAVKQNNGYFRIRYTTGEGKDADKFKAVHELGHVFLTATNFSSEKYHNSMPAQGPCKFDLILNDFYGLEIAEGTINFLAQIAILKKDYSEYMDMYLMEGGSLFKKDHYKPVEEVARLLTIASVNCYDKDPAKKYSELILTDEFNSENGSLFINSAINNDFEFEKEYDKLMGIEGACLNLYEDIKKIHEQSVKEENLDKELIEKVLNNIYIYYNKRIQENMVKGYADSEHYGELIEKFSEKIESVKEKLKVKIGEKHDL